MSDQGKLLFKTELPGRVLVKKNNTQRKYSFKHKRTFTMASDAFLAWQEKALFYLRQAGLYKKTIEQNVAVKFTFNFANRKSLPDLSNCYGGPEDCLQKANIIKNDRQIRSHDGSRIKVTDKDSVEIEIYEFLGE